MAASVTLLKKSVSPAGGVTFDFSDGASLEFASEADIQTFVNSSNLDVVAAEQLRLYLIGWSGRNGNTVNKTATFDMENQAGNIVRIQ